MPAIINCHLDVGLRTENVAVYVCKGRVQCFNFTALKCSCPGNISIELLTGEGGAATSQVQVANFGNFIRNSSGICFEPATNLGAGITQFRLFFTATDQCDTTNFSVNFVYDPCSCCRSRKCQ